MDAVPLLSRAELRRLRLQAGHLEDEEPAIAFLTEWMDNHPWLCECCQLLLP